ncbi:TonB-dependent receptor [Segetibacter aerophilus]|uniref:TonB-dependent receptor n=1 Tax=Segetibacter aerophilus TaxID=670293 RepID=A0A512BDG0_9BACT|nr:TonB-dependent receptor plug domain-containing protein [Segetibacter aerophilus]GEO10002.1 TonB-dependent receptor [Segetibacter aerophilus]
MRLFKQILLLCFLLASVTNYAQKTKSELITGAFRSADIDEFVKTIEQQTNYTFYYNRAQFDSFAVTITVTAMPLTELLKTVFQYTDFNASIDNEHHVFLTKGVSIVTTLAAPGSTNRNDSLKNARLSSNQNNGKPIIGAQTFANDKLYQIGVKTPGSNEGTAVVSLYVTSLKTQEPLSQSSIGLDGKDDVATTDSNGMYRLVLSKGRHIVTINSFGKKAARRQLIVYADGLLPVEMEDEIRVLEDVLVSTQRNINVNRAQMGSERLNIKTIKQVPAVFGEADVLRVILTLPGVKSVGEASTGFNVRGGGADQNLILFNDATIYNPSHFFGFFSAFNPEVIKDVELFKSSIPAKYGGRLSSVLNITSREGSKTKYSGTAGVGLLTSRITVEGPIQKDKSSFIFGARTTYANWLLELLPKNSNYRNSAASFYDFNLLLSQKINERNDLYFTGYASKDQFNLNNDTVYGYQNRSLSIKWKHVFNSRLEGAFTTGHDSYKYQNSSEENKINAYKMGFDINQLNLKTDFTYTLDRTHIIDFGLSAVYYKLHPGSFVPVGQESLVTPNVSSPEQAAESAVYINDRYDFSNKFSVSGGIRYSMFNYLGAQNVNVYAAGLPKQESTLINKVSYTPGQVIKTYHGPEVRLSAKYSLTKSFFVKGSYNTLRQYIHMLSNTTAISPTDIWKLSDLNIKPQFGEQFSIGFFKNFGVDSIETSVEVYYKKIQNTLDYRSGAQLVLNPHIETDVINARGKAYGVELMVKKRIGKLNGWMSYTWSRTLLQMNDPNIGTPVNGGKFYPANYDKPHDATVVGNYAINHRFSLSLNLTYSTGRPITLPIGRYYYGGSQRALYSDRNANRIPDYFRTDFSMNIDGNHKVHQLTHNSWTIGVYNLTGRKNPYSVYFTSENGVVNGYKLSIFGSAIPFINYNIRF